MNINLTIIKPYKVENKLYKRIILISIVSLCMSFVILNEKYTILNQISDVLKNLSYGCIASTVVAWLIDCVNVRNQNQKANDLYHTIYNDLKYQLAYFVGIWAELGAVAYRDENFKNQKLTWTDWYKQTKEKYHALEERQPEILDFFKKQLTSCVSKVRESIEKVQSQEYMLSINDLTNSDLHNIIEDFRFEFYAFDLGLSRNDETENFWLHMDAITKDLERYIGNWNDINYYNFVEFKPYKFLSDPEETKKAIEKSGKDIINRMQNKI